MPLQSPALGNGIQCCLGRDALGSAVVGAEWVVRPLGNFGLFGLGAVASQNPVIF